MRDYKLDQGRIAERALPEPVFDQEFIDKVLQALDQVDGNGIEQVLKKQGGFRAIAWSTKTAQ
jgi:hypothetical protein